MLRLLVIGKLEDVVTGMELVTIREVVTARDLVVVSGSEFVTMRDVVSEKEWDIDMVFVSIQFLPW